MKTKQIIIIGAGNIVRSGHLPAYHKAGFKVKGIYDHDQVKAAGLARDFAIPKVFTSIGEICGHTDENTVLDIAVPASALLDLLEQLPDGSSVLLQKPMGENLKQAVEILKLCRIKKLNAGVNFQLRYAPFVLEARKMIDAGLLGELCDIEVNVNVYTPWQLWEFLKEVPRLEILYHSIHYIDLIRCFWGNPKGIYAKTVKHPEVMGLASVRSNIIMDYGERIRANILTNHTHRFGQYNQQSYLKFEGTKGAIKIKMGVLMDYPDGVRDEFEYILFENDHSPKWKKLELKGSWFPDAFICTMAAVMKGQEPGTKQPDNSVEDAIYTMACVEAAYLSNDTGMPAIDFSF